MAFAKAWMTIGSAGAMVPSALAEAARVCSLEPVASSSTSFALDPCAGGPIFPRATAAFPEIRAGRLPHYSFRGLLGVHSRYGLPARQVAYATLCIEGFDCFVASTAAPIATGWSESCRAGLSPAEDLRLFHGARSRERYKADSRSA